MTLSTDARAGVIPDPSPRAKGDRPADRRRPPLDGLRAVAVALVLGFHMFGGGKGLFPGGFLGVDIFFVLSGYLITRLLLGEWRATGRVRLGRFWFRRIRRLVPPLLLLGTLTTLAVWWAASPEVWPQQRADLLWTLSYAANWHFMALGAWSGETLFDPPLSHTWSLAIEEQFYLAWPLLIAAALSLGARWPRWRMGIPVALATVGICASAWWMASRSVAADPVGAYYATWGRAGELLAGALLALAWPLVLTRFSGRWGQRIAVVGWVVLGIAVMIFGSTMSAYYQGGSLLVSAAVVAVLIGLEAGGDGRIRRLLGSPAFAGLGRISYGVYLYHYLTILLLPVSDADVPHALAVQACRLTITLGLAVLSFQLVERPIQNGTFPLLGPSPRRVLVAILTAGGLTVALSTVMLRLPGDLDQQLAQAAPATCVQGAPPGAALCSPAGRPGGTTWLVTGGANAAAVARALATQVRPLGVRVAVGAPPNCTGSGSVGCAVGMGETLESGLRLDPSLVLVTYGTVPPGLSTPSPGADETHEALRALLDLVDRAAQHGAHTILVSSPLPDSGLGPFVAPGRPRGAPSPTPAAVATVRAHNDVLAGVAALRPDTASLISVDDVVCPAPTVAGGCPAVVDGVLVHGSRGAYTPRFAQLLAPTLAARVLSATRTTTGARGDELRLRPPTG